jgi:hypothetical protein
MHLIFTCHMVHNESIMLGDIAIYHFYRNIMILLKTYKN